MSETGQIDALRLIRSENVGPVTWHALCQRCGSPGEALRALPDLAKRGGRRAAIRVASIADAEQELAAIARAGARVVSWGEADYPAPLGAIPDAPPILILRGDTRLLHKPTVGLVGARNASANGVRIAREMASSLGEAGIVVASGLARGIDTAAHRGALKTGTIAVLAGGIDIVYPPENKELQAEIAEQGLIVAEMPPGTVPQARHFPRRNRIVSGLSLGVIVVEAALRSGSLITARLAGEQGRDVFAVPGSPLDPRCRGSNNLLREGAILTESAEDVLRVLEPGTVVRADPAIRTPVAEIMVENDMHSLVLERLGPSPIEVDELIRQCGIAPGAVMTVLLDLELAGRLARQPGNRVNLV